MFIPVLDSVPGGGLLFDSVAVSASIQGLSMPIQSRLNHVSCKTVVARVENAASTEDGRMNQSMRFDSRFRNGEIRLPLPQQLIKAEPEELANAVLEICVYGVFASHPMDSESLMLYRLRVPDVARLFTQQSMPVTFKVNLPSICFPRALVEHVAVMQKALLFDMNHKDREQVETLMAAAHCKGLLGRLAASQYGPAEGVEPPFECRSDLYGVLENAQHAAYVQKMAVQLEQARIDSYTKLRGIVVPEKALTGEVSVPVTPSSPMAGEEPVGRLQRVSEALGLCGLHEEAQAPTRDQVSLSMTVKYEPNQFDPTRPITSSKEEDVRGVPLRSPQPNTSMLTPGGGGRSSLYVSFSNAVLPSDVQALFGAGQVAVSVSLVPNRDEYLRQVRATNARGTVVPVLPSLEAEVRAKRDSRQPPIGNSKKHFTVGLFRDLAPVRRLSTLVNRSASHPVRVPAYDSITRSADGNLTASSRHPDSHFHVVLEIFHVPLRPTLADKSYRCIAVTAIPLDQFIPVDRATREDGEIDYDRIFDPVTNRTRSLTCLKQLAIPCLPSVTAALRASLQGYGEAAEIAAVSASLSLGVTVWSEAVELDIGQPRPCTPELEDPEPWVSESEPTEIEEEESVEEEEQPPAPYVGYVSRGVQITTVDQDPIRYANERVEELKAQVIEKRDTLVDMVIEALTILKERMSRAALVPASLNTLVTDIGYYRSDSKHPPRILREEGVSGILSLVEGEVTDIVTKQLTPLDTASSVVSIIVDHTRVVYQVSQLEADSQALVRRNMLIAAGGDAGDADGEGEGEGETERDPNAIRMEAYKRIVGAQHVLLSALSDLSDKVTSIPDTTSKAERVAKGDRYLADFYKAALESLEVLREDGGRERIAREVSSQSPLYRTVSGTEVTPAVVDAEETMDAA
ncbi:hypothetical protein KIPB_005292, partial [Kipferlia bialata]|eukprot:g5292.t1